MASPSRIDALLHAWSAWLENGRILPAKQQVTHFLNTGVRGNFGPKAPDISHCIELDIDVAVGQLAKLHPIKATVLRTEYSRRFARLRQLDRAVALEISLRTYQRHLQQAKQFIEERL